MHYNMLQKHKIGKMELSKINRQVYQKFINDYSKEHAKETIRKTNGAIRSALDDALYDGLILKIPLIKLIIKPENLRSQNKKNSSR